MKIAIIILLALVASALLSSYTVFDMRYTWWVLPTIFIWFFVVGSCLAVMIYSIVHILDGS